MGGKNEKRGKMGGKIFSRNRKANYDYEVMKSYEAGLVLRGSEVKSIRAGGVQLRDSYARFMSGGLWVINMPISRYRYDQNLEDGEDLARMRKLLLNKKELDKLKRSVKEKGLSLVILKLYQKKNWIKAELGLCRGKKRYDKRESIREREDERRLDRLRKLYR